MGKKEIKSIANRGKLRVHKHLFSLNDYENKALERYLVKYKVSNKSKFIRETLMYAILKKFDEDTPTLFD
ncbi:hypothetical protein SDC9_160072 [bioreactor metagenome]|uniref:Uncharacterized protein n=1 Tax=bioreactor metagenome TaxID=1076179 RepID=A0A645FGX7_9ZZZZ|nr:hypothetical protein [Paludibacter sp.]